MVYLFIHSDPLCHPVTVRACICASFTPNSFKICSHPATPQPPILFKPAQSHEDKPSLPLPCHIYPHIQATLPKRIETSQLHASKTQNSKLPTVTIPHPTSATSRAQSISRSLSGREFSPAHVVPSPASTTHTTPLYAPTHCCRLPSLLHRCLTCRPVLHSLHAACKPKSAHTDRQRAACMRAYRTNAEKNMLLAGWQPRMFPTQEGFLPPPRVGNIGNRVGNLMVKCFLGSLGVDCVAEEWGFVFTACGVSFVRSAWAFDALSFNVRRPSLRNSEAFKLLTPSPGRLQSSSMFRRRVSHRLAHCATLKPYLKTLLPLVGVYSSPNISPLSCVGCIWGPSLLASNLIKANGEKDRH